jgi:hypothetical protein
MELRIVSVVSEYAVSNNLRFIAMDAMYSRKADLVASSDNAAKSCVSPHIKLAIKTKNQT